MISEFKFYRVRVRVNRRKYFDVVSIFSGHWRSNIIFFFIFLPFWTNENTLTSDMLYINRIKDKFAVRISQNPKMLKL